MKASNLLKNLFFQLLAICFIAASFLIIRAVKPVHVGLNNFLTLRKLERNIAGVTYISPEIRISRNTKNWESKKVLVKALKKSKSYIPVIVEKNFEIDLNGIEAETEVSDISFMEPLTNDDSGEINTNELIQLTGFEVKVPEVINLASFLENSPLKETLARLASEESKRIKPINNIDPQDPALVANFVNDEEDINDAVQTVQASTIKREPAIVNDEPVLIDYTKPTEDSIELVESKPLENIEVKTRPPHLSQNILQAIEREMADQKTKRLVQKTSPAPFRPAPAKSEPEPQPDALMNSGLNIRAFSASVDEEIGEQVYSLTFVPGYNKSESFNSDSNGNINIDLKKNGYSGTLRGTLVSMGHIRTTVDIHLGDDNEELVVPLIDAEKFTGYLEEITKNTNMNPNDIYGGFVLVHTDDHIDDVDISGGQDEKYFSRIFLDEDFKTVERGGNVRFILFLGVVPGNRLISYLLNDGSIAEKVVFVEEDKIHFEEGKISRGEQKKINLTETSIMSQEPSELNINGNQMRYFNRDITAQSKAPGVYEIKAPAIVDGMRNYVEISHLKSSIFAGFSGNKSIELPSTSFIENIMGIYQIEELSNVCLLQINLKKIPISIETDIDSIHHGATLNAAFLDSDGKFQVESSLKTKKAFILGDSEGVINMKVNYDDGSSDYLMSYCSLESYLVEQL